MVAFKKMWEDVRLILSDEDYSGIEILERFNCGFTVKERDNVIFITRDDFVDFWCKLLYYSELSLEQVSKDDKLKPKYIYTIIKQLPYISENSGVIKLMQ
ncbi:hypothetical protein K9O30_10100 [Clostridium bowmanii]|uniref:hypothetical protein n=1 Tax=Clostridium bowmanii TaxID=132925 RepID=UPI001C0C2C90|nr:hypothetical protein [Clostridium bowmanii]MBU3189451.1 hypothetical protein [Clostridium bowmanii]MCA1074066.1 hypothetical protein [Clostridium bowmanii]